MPPAPHHPRQKHRVAITGLGVVTPFGEDVDAFFQHLLQGDSAIRLFVADAPPRPLAMPAAHCPDFAPDARLGRPLAASMDRFSQFAAVAAFQAWSDAGLPRDTEQNDWGVSWGTALGGTMAYEKGYRNLWCQQQDRIPPLSVILGMNNAAAAHLSIRLGLGGPCLSYTIACASASIAIGEAFRRIRDGEASLMLAGGSDAPLAYGVVRAWEALRVLAPGDADTAFQACRPFSADRAGLVLGEGAGALVLENRDQAIARGARIHGELTGYATAADHHHLVRPAVDGQVRTLQAALADAGLTAEAVDYVNAHGTATAEGDPAEISALKTVFGNHAARLAVSATKSMHGHMMGATGAIEAIVTVLALREGVMPPTAHLQQVAEDCAGVRHLTTATRQPLRNALSSSFAFGGSNAVLAFAAPDPILR